MFAEEEMIEERLAVEHRPFIAEMKRREGANPRGRPRRISNESVEAPMLVAPETDTSRAARRRHVPRNTTSPLFSFRCNPSVKEIADQRDHFVGLVLQGEVAGVDQME